MKAMGFEQPRQSQQHSQKNTNPEIGVSLISNNSSINGNSSTKKQLKKEKETNNNNKPKWISLKLEEKKRLWKKELEEPLLKRIPKNLLTSLGWKNPITIISPFTNRNNNNQQQPIIDKEEAIKIWNQNPAPKQFLEKTIIEQQKFIHQNKTKQKGGGGGNSGGGGKGGINNGHLSQQRKQQMTTNNCRRAMN
uniref:Uncharacterized protein n=1 Tax=Meloidogyne floridensis TaxID=298350 RepID=A0A915P0E9_9BILA